MTEVFLGELSLKFCKHNLTNPYLEKMLMSPDLFVPNYMKSASFPHTYSLLPVAKAVLFSLVPTLVVCESVAARRILIFKTDVSLI